MKQDINVTENREKYVGGSDMPIILGMSPYKTPFQLAKEKAGLVERTFDASAYTEYGNILEPQIRDYLNASAGLNFQPDTFIDENERIRANVDGYEKEEGLLLEIKTHGANPSNESYYAQIQLYLHVYGLDCCWLAKYRRPADFETDLEAYKFDVMNMDIEMVKYDADYGQKLIEAIHRFWVQVDALKMNPDMTESEFHQAGNNELMAKVTQLAAFENEIQRLKQLEKDAKTLRDELIDLMENTALKKIDTGNVVVTYVAPSVRTSIDSAKLRDELPEIYEQYKRLTTTRASVRIKTVVLESDFDKKGTI